MENEKDNIEDSNGKGNGNFDATNKDLTVISDKSSEIPSLLDENKKNTDQMATSQAALTMPSTTETTPDSQVVNNLSFSSLSETKTTKRQGDAILEVAEQTTAYNVQVTSNNPTTIDVASSALQPGQGHSSIVIEKPEQVIIHENVKVKDSFAVQLGQNNVLGAAQTPESEGSPGSALVGATSAAVSQTQLVIRQPGTVLLYSRKDIASCENVQIGDNNIMGKLEPHEDKFVKTCIKLGINPEQKEDIFERLGHEETREQFSAMMAEKCNVQCKLRNAGEGCILLELEVPTEEDRLQLLRMARDGTFQQVLLETFLPEFAAEGRAVNMNLAIAIAVRNPSQDMVEELQGAVASSDHEDVVVVEIPATSEPSTPKSEQTTTNKQESEPAEGQASKQPDDTGDLAEAEELPEVASSKPALYTDDVPTLSKKLLPEGEDGEGEITVSVEGAETVPLGTGAAAAADFPPEGFDDKFLTCDICHNIYEDPRVLPCGHTFCARCLETWQKRKSEFTCPTCRKQVPLQGTGVASLPRNYQISYQLDFRASQNVKEAYACCQMCESGARVAGLCSECYLFLCKSCIAIHAKAPVMKEHHITLLDSPGEFCPKHTDQPMAFYCQPCDKLVCGDCIKTKHQPGPDHDPQGVSNAAQKFKTELQTLVGETSNKLKETDYILRKDLLCITTNCELQKMKIQEHFTQLRATLDEEERELTSRLRDMEEKGKDPLLKETKALEETSKSTKDGVQFCEDILARGSDVEILTLGQSLKDNLNRLRTDKIKHSALAGEISFQNYYRHGKRLNEGNLYPGYPRTVHLSVTELPVESLPTSIIHRQTGDEETDPVTLTVIPLGEPNESEPNDEYFLEKMIQSEFPVEQCVRLDTSRISEGAFEAAWRPQTSGKHMVGITKRGGGPGHVKWVRDYRSPIVVDVGSNNPVLRLGQKGSRQGQFDRPRDVAVRGDRLYVADNCNQRVQVFDLSGKFCSSFPTAANPASVSVQTDGTIVVNCDEDVVLMKFSPSGELINKFPLGEYCTLPYGLAVQKNGRLVAVEPGKHSIFLFEADGALVKQVGGLGKRKGQFNRPCFVCVDNEDNIIVADTGNSRIQVFDKDLNFQHKFGVKDREPGDMCHPMGVSADSRGNIVLANIGETIDGIVQGLKLQVFHKDGTWVSTISSDGDKLNRPHGVAVTEDGHVFVTDTKDHCIRKYRYM